MMKAEMEVIRPKPGKLGRGQGKLLSTYNAQVALMTKKCPS